jgi:manganese-dependent inorganic pyrophosphatase
MSVATYVLGHKNPDSDAICAALDYTALLHLQGQPDAVAARQGVLRRETAYILERFGMAAPLLVTDLRPRVADVIAGPAVSVHQDTPLYEVGQILRCANIRAVPVVDDANHLCGMAGVEDLAQGFLGGLDLDHLDHVPLHLENAQRVLGGQVLVAAPGRTLRDRVMVGAMAIDSMLKRLAPDILLVMWDRADAKRAAIEYGVGALVVTGDQPVSEEILARARERRGTVIAVPHHTYTTVRLILLSTPVRYVMRTEVPTCSPDDLIEEVRERLRSGAARSLVVGEDRTVAGHLRASWPIPCCSAGPPPSRRTGGWRPPWPSARVSTRTSWARRSCAWPRTSPIARPSSSCWPTSRISARRAA